MLNNKLEGVLKEHIKLREFPFSLVDIAKDWWYYLHPRFVTCKNDMKRLFLEKIFLTSTVATTRKNIIGLDKIMLRHFMNIGRD